MQKKGVNILLIKGFVYKCAGFAYKCFQNPQHFNSNGNMERNVSNTMAEVNLSSSLNSFFPRVVTAGHSETEAFPCFMYTQTKAEDKLVQRRDGGKQQGECSFCVMRPFFAA